MLLLSKNIRLINQEIRTYNIRVFHHSKSKGKITFAILKTPDKTFLFADFWYKYVK